MIGPIIDSGCLLAGGLAGAYSSHLVPKRIKESLPPIFGVVTLCMGMTLVNKVAAMPVVVAALLLGTLLGELFFAERLLSAIIKKLLLATRRRDMPVDEATVLSLVTLVSAFCFGSMGIFGAVTEAITGKPDILLAKAVLDIFSGLLFGAVFGGIVGCIALPQFAVLTLCYLCGNFCAPFMTPPCWATSPPAAGSSLWPRACGCAASACFRSSTCCPPCSLRRLFPCSGSIFSAHERFAPAKGIREAATQRRPAQRERIKRIFFAKRQDVWFGMQSVSS